MSTPTNAPLTVEKFRELIADARKKNPRCVYCDKNHARTPLKGLMYMLESKRLACAKCPEAFEVMVFSTRCGG